MIKVQHNRIGFTTIDAWMRFEIAENVRSVSSPFFWPAAFRFVSELLLVR
jgi:hypothetical protein